MKNEYEEPKFVKEKVGDKIEWDANSGIGEFVFRFEGEQEEFNMFRDYPWRLTEQQKKIFDEENPFWADFFKDRK